MCIGGGAALERMRGRMVTTAPLATGRVASWLSMREVVGGGLRWCVSARREGSSRLRAHRRLLLCVALSSLVASVHVPLFARKMLIACWSIV